MLRVFPLYVRRVPNPDVCAVSVGAANAPAHSRGPRSANTFDFAALSRSSRFVTAFGGCTNCGGTVSFPVRYACATTVTGCTRPPSRNSCKPGFTSNPTAASATYRLDPSSSPNVTGRPCQVPLTGPSATENSTGDPGNGRSGSTRTPSASAPNAPARLPAKKIRRCILP